MQKLWFPLLLGASVAVFMLWSFDRPVPNAIPPGSAGHYNYPTDYFLSPVSGAVHVTGTCGELRPDHFHAGLDIDGRTGDPVFAAADGYIETIRIQPSGYGNLLLVRHPNGYTTAYAHLSRFVGPVQEYLRKQQYERERFELELKLPPDLFPVQKGQQIAYLGNTGSSSGPHLHFEIRNQEGKAVNPLLCGIPVSDNIPPDLREMKIYLLNEHREVLQSKPLPLDIDKAGHIGLEGDTVRIGAGRVGFAIKTYDQTTGFRNDNGVFSVALFADDQLAFQWTANEFDFDDARYLNAHIDYAVRKKYGAWFHRCFSLPGDFLGNYTRTPDMGAIRLSADKPVKITLKVSDAFNNTSTLNFWAIKEESLAEPVISLPYQFLVPFDSDTKIDLNGISLEIPKKTVYETLALQYSVMDDSSSDIYSLMHLLQDERTPVHSYFNIKLLPNRLPDRLRSKAVVANCNEGRPDNCGGSWQGDWLCARTRSFGNYCIMADTVPPRISPVGFSADMRRKSAISFRIFDNFAVAGEAENLQFKGTIDGKWVLFEYDKKSNRLTYTFDEHVGKGSHVVRLAVSDDRGNENVYEGKFLR